VAGADTAVGRDLMARLDLRILEIMDYSEGNRHVGNTDLPKAVVDRYYDQYPDVHRLHQRLRFRPHLRPPRRPAAPELRLLPVHRSPRRAEAAADLEELIQLNPQRPYFLLMHVRESNTVEKVADILGRLSESVEVIPLDVFLQLAAGAKTYRTHYQQPTDAVDRNP
jgi:hypothetical protein